MAIKATFRIIGWILGGAALTTTAMAAPDAAPLIDRAQVDQAGLNLYWQRSLPLQEDETLLRMNRLEENLYLLTTQGRVITLDAATGVYRWAAVVGGPKIRVFGPTHGPDLVYFATVQGTQARDRVNGDLIMRWDKDYTPSGPSATDGQMLYNGTIMSRLIALRLKDMQILWEVGVKGLVTSAPILIGPNLYFVDQSGHIYAANKEDKTRLWEAQTTGPVAAAPAVHGDRMFVASMDQSLWCFELATGRTLWRRRMPTPLPDAPRATDSSVYLPVLNRGVSSIDPRTGDVNWYRPEVVDLLAELDGQVWLLGERGNLIGCDKTDGRIRREIPCQADLHVANDVDDAIWVATTRGRVVCIRPKNAGFLRYQSAQRARARQTPVNSQSTAESSEQAATPDPAPRSPVDYLRSPEGVLPIGGNRAGAESSEAGR